MMTFVWMRLIDNWIGKPAALFLGLFTRRPRSLFGDRHSTVRPRRVICAKFIGLGSVVLSLPLLKQLHEQGIEVAFWSFPSQAALVKQTGYAAHIWTIEPSFRNFLPSLLKSFTQALRFKACAFLDLEPTANFTALLARLCGVKTRIGFMCAKPIRERLFTHLVALSPEKHLIEHTLRMGELLGLAPVSGIAVLPPIPQSILQTDINPAINGRKTIVLNINSSDLSWHRMWAKDNWVTLCRELLKDPEVHLIFPGVASERRRVNAVLKQLTHRTRVHNLAGKTNLREIIVVLTQARLVVSVDSGIMHLAAWAGAPLVALFGPETPSLYGPRLASARVVWAALPCSPCLSAAADKITRCQDNQCMKKIAVHTVLAQCHAALGMAASHPKRVNTAASKSRR